MKRARPALTSILYQEYTLCENVYPYTVTDDRVGRGKKRNDNGKKNFPMRLKFSYHEALLCHLCSEEVLE